MKKKINRKYRLISSNSSHLVVSSSRGHLRAVYWALAHSRYAHLHPAGRGECQPDSLWFETLSRHQLHAHARKNPRKQHFHLKKGKVHAAAAARSAADR